MCKAGYIMDAMGYCRCETGFYDFFDGENTVCKACDNNCDSSCGGSEDCYKCADTAINYSQQCKEINFGYKTAFKEGIITIFFASDISYYLTKKNFKVNSNDGRTFDTESWWVERYNLKTYKIHTDLARSDLPVSVVLDFNRG
ncbi:unnamed protein product [Blepharisma stoltei]|uniref:Uncharacterized protein n=1 Tax=Blepharisma stoltei TaxID=1481888 RepID=A0AAU9IZG4_9CILI|nr:unnamed protein product [Blepharisma stoltei]